MTVTGRRKSLHRHDRAMHHARPDGKPYEAQVIERIASGEQEEKAQSRVDANNHQRVIRMSGVPGPSGRPDDHERVNPCDEYDANEYECDSQVFQASNVIHFLVWLCLFLARLWKAEFRRPSETEISHGRVSWQTR